MPDRVAFYESIVRTAAEGVCVCLPVDAFPHVRFIVWNDRMTRITGYTMDEINERGWYQTLYPDAETSARAAERMGRMRRGDDLVNEEWRITRKDGAVRVVAFSTARVDADPGEPAVVALLSDVTERHEAAAALREVAHDFNNLMTCVAGFAGLARRADGPLVEVRLRQIERAALRAAELSQQLLAYAGRGRRAVGPLDLNAALEETAGLLAAAVSPGVRLRLDLSPVPAVEGDATQLRQVMMNLITNAAEALGAGGDVTVRTRPHAGPPAGHLILAGRCGPAVCLEVSDTGCGMDEATRARVFEPFFTTKPTGRGLGLAAVLGIVRGHGGALSVDSAPGRGTTFRVYLAATDAAPPEAAKEAPAAPVALRGRALIADDEGAVRELLRGALEAMGLEVLEAADGEEALAAFREHGPSLTLVLLDLTMPRLGGLEAWRAMRRHGPAVPAVLMSGDSEEELRRRHGEGLPAVLAKPFTLERLERAVAGAVASRAC